MISSEWYQHFYINRVTSIDWHQYSEINWVKWTRWSQQCTTLWSLPLSHRPAKKATHNITTNFRCKQLILTYFMLPPHTVNMTLFTSLITNGRQLGWSESFISHCPLYPVNWAQISVWVSLCVLQPNKIIIDIASNEYHTLTLSNCKSFFLG